MTLSGIWHKVWHYREALLVAALVLVAFGIRQFRLAELMTFTYDQGRDMYVLQRISRGDPTLIGPTTGLPGVFLGPFYYYALLPGFLLSEGSPFGVATWQTFLIVLTFPLLYLMLKPRIGAKWAVLTLLALIVTPGAIYQARTIWNPSFVVPTILITLFALFRSRRNPWWLAVAAFAYGLSLQTELAYTLFLAPMLGIWTLWFIKLPEWLITVAPKRLHILWKRPNAVYAWQHLVLAAFAFALTLAPQGLFEIRNRFLITTSFVAAFSDTSKQVPLAQIWRERPTEIVRALSDTLTANAPATHVLLAGVVASSVVVLVLMRTEPEAWIWLGYCWLPLILLMFHRGNNGSFFDYYVNAHYLPMLTILFLAVHQLGKRFPMLLKGLIAAVVIIWASIFLRFVRIHFDIANFQYTAATQMAALRYARTLAPEGEVPLEVFVPNLIPVAYQYLNEWMAQSAQVTPMNFGITAEKTYILLSEPSISDGSKVAFEQWQGYWVTPAKCDEPMKIGITQVRRCEK